MNDSGSTRKDVRVPNELIAEVEEYQKKNNIRYWTVAMLLLVRKGLDCLNKKRRVNNRSLFFCLSNLMSFYINQFSSKMQ